jgi:imidazole glycerol-phosphate synthase subunit HisH
VSVNPASNKAVARIAVVDHGTGNLTSIVRALELAGAMVDRVSKPQQIDDADAVVLPGVGAFPRAIDSIRQLGLTDAIRSAAESDRPFMGVCLGMQLLFEGSDEMGGAEGLGIIRGRVRKLDSQGERLPHIGWSNVHWRVGHRVISGLTNPAPMYHVHSFVCDAADGDQVLATAEHGEVFTTAVHAPALVAFQFHPEKSSRDGLRAINNFVRWAEDRESR